MATKTFYLGNTVSDSWRRLVDGTAQTAATLTDGWTVSTGATLHSEYQVLTKRAATTFTGTTVPDGTLDTTLKDALRSQNVYTGDFAAGNWTFTFVVQAATAAGTQAGRVRFRVIKANNDGSSATEITSAQQLASAVTLTATATDFTSSLTLSLPAISLNNQYLFIQIAWERTAAGGMTTADVSFRTGSSAAAGTRIVTTDFTAAQALTGATVTGVRVIDAYDETNYAGTGIILSANGDGIGQSFVGTEVPVTACRFYLGNSVSSAGTYCAKLFAATGTHGTDAKPIGAPLATSNSAAMGSVPTSNAWATLTFPAPPIVSSGVTYVIAVEVLTFTSGNNLNVGIDTSSPTHAGNRSTGAGGSWSVSAANDLIFEVDTGPAAFAPTVALGGGGGAAQAVTGTTIASTLAVGQPTIAPGAVTLTGATRASTAQLNVPTVALAGAADQAVTTATLSAASALTAPSIAPGAVTVLGATRATSAALNVPSITTGAVTVTGATRATTLTLTAPSVTVGAVTVLAATRPATSTLFALSVTTGAVPVTGATITTSAILRAPAVAVGPATVTGATCAATTTLFAPTVTTAGAITGASLASSSVLFAVSVFLAVTAPTFPALLVAP